MGVVLGVVAHGVGFNRTFMELKLPLADSAARVRGFQSYLYGIEIGLTLFINDLVFLFQSYLYGIEMCASLAPYTHI